MGIKTSDITATYENDNEVAKDHVISFTPLVDTPVAPGTKVQLVISLGPKTEQVAVPSLTERTLEQATSDLNTMNLAVGKTDEVYSDTVQAGKVVGQYPAAYTQVEAGTKVNLQISKGPDPASAPKEVTKNVDIDLPVSSQSVSVQVIMDGEVIFDESVDAAMNTCCLRARHRHGGGDQDSDRLFRRGAQQHLLRHAGRVTPWKGSS
ncbi:MAG: PASTA domain-containing protein [Lawsonibacter sp.]